MRTIVTLLALLACAGCSSPSARSPLRVEPDDLRGMWKKSEVPPGRITVAHPSLDRMGLYHVIYSHPADCTINTNLGFVLVVRDDRGRTMATAHLEPDTIEKEQWVEFRLAGETILRSSLEFQIHPNTEDVTWISIPLGKQETVRKVDGQVVRESIHRTANHASQDTSLRADPER